MRNLKTIEGSPLNKTSIPFRLYQKAKKYGLWDPDEIDLTVDQQQWKNMDPALMEHSLVLFALFVGGEEAVTLDLLPLINAVAKEGYIEEVMYLSAFLFEEAKHTEFFTRVLEEFVGQTKDLSIYLTDDYKKIYYDELPAALARLAYDQSPEAIAIASTTYNIISEEVLAEFGFEAFNDAFGQKGFLPGLMKGIALLRRDETRHISYGTFLLQRLICQNGDIILQVIENHLSKLLPYCIRLIGRSKGDRILKKVDIRLDILRRARGKTVDELYAASYNDRGKEIHNEP